MYRQQMNLKCKVKKALEEANIRYNEEYIYYDIFESSLLEELINKLYKEKICQMQYL